jgi:predicted ATPase
MQLFAALGASLSYTKSPVPESGAAWANALEIAESIGDSEYQLRALWGLWIYRLSCGECRTALALAQRFCSLGASSTDPGDVFIGDRMIGVSMHYLGDQTTARRHIERMLDHYVIPVQRSHIMRFQFDQRVAGRMILARILWLQGFPDQALRTAQDNVEDARRIGHALSLYYALEGACLIPLFVGDLPAAERSLAMLLDHSARHAVSRWYAWGRCFEGALLVKRGEVSTGLGLLRAALDDLRETRFVLRYTAFLGDLAEALSRAGEFAQGLEAIDEALDRSERNDERWCIAELCRIKGELVLLDKPTATVTAEGHFQDGLRWAREQGSLSWELRCATSLARLWQVQGQSKKARALLAPVYDRFKEGFATADLQAAKAHLDALQ